MEFFLVTPNSLCYNLFIGQIVKPQKASHAGMAELADAHGSGPCEGYFMEVRVLLPAPKAKDKVYALSFAFLSCRRGLGPPELRVRLPILRGLSHSVKWDSEAKKELRSHKEGRKVALPILRGLSHSVKWDSEAKELSGGVSEACDACTKSKRQGLRLVFCFWCAQHGRNPTGESTEHALVAA